MPNPGGRELLIYPVLAVRKRYNSHVEIAQFYFGITIQQDHQVELILQ
jgi:hypothetical protein